MQKFTRIVLLGALYITIVQAIPLGSFISLNDNGETIWADPAGIGAATAGKVTSKGESWPYRHNLHTETTSPMATTTRTVTSTVTRTVPWSSKMGSNPPTFRWNTMIASPTITSDTKPLSKNHSRNSWSLEEQPPSTVMTTSIFYVVGSIACVSMAYILAHMFFALIHHRKTRRYCCFWRKALTENALRGVELEESAGVSWTDGSNITTPHPELRPEEWSGSWAAMAIVGQERVFGSTGRASVVSPRARGWSGVGEDGRELV